MGKRINKNNDDILNFDEYFQTFELSFQDENEMSLQEIKIEKENLVKLIQNLTKMIEELSNFSRLKNQLSAKITSNLTEELKIMNNSLDENRSKNQKIINDLKLELYSGRRLVIALFCFQIAYAIVLVFLIYFRKF
jgi:hypothetical protein